MISRVQTTENFGAAVKFLCSREPLQEPKGCSWEVR